MSERVPTLLDLKTKYFRHILDLSPSASSPIVMRGDDRRSRKPLDALLEADAAVCTCYPPESSFNTDDMLKKRRLERHARPPSHSSSPSSTTSSSSSTSRCLPSAWQSHLRRPPPPSPRQRPRQAIPLSPSPSDATAAEALDMFSPNEKDDMIMQMHSRLRHLGGRLDEVIALAERNASCVEKAHEDALSYRLVSEQQLLGEIHQWRHRHPQVHQLQDENVRLREEIDRTRRQYLAALSKLARR